MLHMFWIICRTNIWRYSTLLFNPIFTTSSFCDTYHQNRHLDLKEDITNRIIYMVMNNSGKQCIWYHNWNWLKLSLEYHIQLLSYRQCQDFYKQRKSSTSWFIKKTVLDNCNKSLQVTLIMKNILVPNYLDQLEKPLLQCCIKHVREHSSFWKLLKYTKRTQCTRYYLSRHKTMWIDTV
jgi:hypothetical protein